MKSSMTCEVGVTFTDEVLTVRNMNDIQHRIMNEADCLSQKSDEVRIPWMNNH